MKEVTELEVGKLVFKGTNSCDEHEWEEVTWNIAELMGTNQYFRVRVSGFGWLAQDGHTVIEVQDEDNFLNQILPNTECSFKVYKYGDGMAINNAHHDKPTGGEWYYIEPMTYEEYEEER